MTDKHLETAKRHLAECMEGEDWPTHNCHATCDDLSYLLAAYEKLVKPNAELRAEVERLKADNEELHLQIDFILAQARAANEQLRARNKAVEARLDQIQPRRQSLT